MPRSPRGTRDGGAGARSGCWGADFPLLPVEGGEGTKDGGFAIPPCPSEGAMMATGESSTTASHEMEIKKKTKICDLNFEI